MKKRLGFILIVVLACGGFAFAQTDPADTQVAQITNTSQVSVMTQFSTITQYNMMTQYSIQEIPPKISMKTPEYAWLMPGLSQYVTGEKAKGRVLCVSFFGTGIGSITSYYVAKSIYAKSQKKWDEALATVDDQKRATTIRESYDFYESSRTTLTLSRCLAGVSAGIWVYSLFDHISTIRNLERIGLTVSMGDVSMRLRFSL